MPPNFSQEQKKYINVMQKRYTTIIKKLRTRIKKLKKKMTAQKPAILQIPAMEIETTKQNPQNPQKPQKPQKQNKKPSKSIMGPSTHLPTTMDSVWNIKESDIKKNSHIKPGKDAIVVTYPAGGHGARSGVNFKSQPKGFPCSQVELSYEVFVPKGWDCVKGGKLPGIFIGKNGTGGKKYEKNDGSCRLMWRAQNQLVPYLYLCTNQGDITKQGPNFIKACSNKFPPAGIDLWRHTKKQKLFLKEGTWNSIVYGVKMNTGDKKNGHLWLELNGTRLEVDDVCFTANDSVKIGGFQFSTWYGGGSASWAPDKPQQLKFRNMSYSI
jgi:hypothetical protein